MLSVISFFAGSWTKSTDPDLGKSSGSMQIRIHNTAKNAVIVAQLSINWWRHVQNTNFYILATPELHPAIPNSVFHYEMNNAANTASWQKIATEQSFLIFFIPKQLLNNSCLAAFLRGGGEGSLAALLVPNCPHNGEDAHISDAPPASGHSHRGKIYVR